MSMVREALQRTVSSPSCLGTAAWWSGMIITVTVNIVKCFPFVVFRDLSLKI